MIAGDSARARSNVMGVVQNVGGVDRILRGAAGLIVLILAFTVLGLLDGTPWGIVAGVAGVVLMGTAVVRFCPAYLPFKFSTCKTAAR